MSTGGSQQPVVTTQQNSPWSGAQPALSEVIGGAGGLYQSGTGYQPYTGPTQAPLDPSFANALAMGQTLAGDPQTAWGSPNVLAAQGLAGSMIGSQGLTPEQRQAAGYLGSIAYGAEGQPGWGINSAQADLLSGVNSTIGKYGDIYQQASGSENPYLQSVIAAHDRQIADKVNSSMSGAGRYGSGAHTDVLGRAMAEAANPVLAQDYQARQQQMLQALQGQTGAAGLGLSTYGNAAQQALAAYGLQNDIYGQGLNRAGQWAQAAPAFDAAQYAGIDRLMGYGDYLNNRGQQGLAGDISLYNAEQAWPWEQLARYNAIATGAGGLGGTRVTTAPSNAPPIGNRILGGALAGGGLGSMFGPVGSGVGALGGGLLGLFQ